MQVYGQALQEELGQGKDRGKGREALTLLALDLCFQRPSKYFLDVPQAPLLVCWSQPVLAVGC